MPLIDPGLIARARDIAEKQAAVVPALIGAGLGLGLSPRRNKLRGAMRGAGVGLTTDAGALLGTLLGSGVGGLGGAAGGALAGTGMGLVQALRAGQIDPSEVARFAQGGAVLGGGLGMAGGAGLGGIRGGIEGFRFGKRHLWDQPWPDDREQPHGVSGGDDEGADKSASFAARLGTVAARTRM